MNKIAITILVAAALPALAGAAEAQGGKTTQDGVYTAAQAKRGSDSYADSCSACHGNQLEGEGEAPGLTGPFLDEHKDRPVGELFSIISTQMPQSAPGTLAPNTYADILAFLLQQNGMPAGNTELPSDQKSLDAITLKAK